MGVGLLTMRRDGFGYLSKQVLEVPEKPGVLRRDTEASVLTQRMTLTECMKLFINIDGVSDSSAMQVSLVDDAEEFLAGTAVAAVKESGVRVAVGIEMPMGKPFRLRVQWPSGKADPHFYAMYLSHEQ